MVYASEIRVGNKSKENKVQAVEMDCLYVVPGNRDRKEFPVRK
jgi:hypothetical protein